MSTSAFFLCSPLNYSAVTRRKLAVAIAIVGLPPVVLMNDPATGLDTMSKRKIYRCIQILRQLVKSAIMIVTKSVSDCVVISDRMAIMLNGQFQCLGTISDLQKRYCRGSIILVKLKPTTFQNSAAINDIHKQVSALLSVAQQASALVLDLPPAVV